MELVATGEKGEKQGAYAIWKRKVLLDSRYLLTHRNMSSVLPDLAVFKRSQNFGHGNSPFLNVSKKQLPDLSNTSESWIQLMDLQVITPHQRGCKIPHDLNVTEG